MKTNNTYSIITLINKVIKILVLASVALLLTACGSSSSSSGATPLETQTCFWGSNDWGSCDWQ